MNVKTKILNKTTDNHNYKITFKNGIYNYCYICQRREGNFYAYCGPSKEYGYHGNGKRIYSKQRREYRTWKHTRKTQWK